MAVAVDRLDVVEAARGWIGTPWIHQARGPKGPAGGVDCVGLLVCIARELGFEEEDDPTYGTSPSPTALLERMARSCDRLSHPADPRCLAPDREPLVFASAGDVVLFSMDGPAAPQHAAILTPAGFIHAIGRKGPGSGVEERSWTAAWVRRQHSAWRWRSSS